MNPDAQAAADAAMAEIAEHGCYMEGGKLVVPARWLSTFLANFFDEWLTKIGGEQAALTQPVEVCEWVDRKGKVSGDRYFDTGCHYGLYPDMSCNEAMPWKFCPYCGKPIREVPFKEVSDEQ